jgi:hypothetical protein
MVSAWWVVGGVSREEGFLLVEWPARLIGRLRGKDVRESWPRAGGKGFFWFVGTRYQRRETPQNGTARRQMGDLVARAKYLEERERKRERLGQSSDGRLGGRQSFGLVGAGREISKEKWLLGLVFREEIAAPVGLVVCPVTSRKCSRGGSKAASGACEQQEVRTQNSTCSLRRRWRGYGDKCQVFMTGTGDAPVE